MFRAAPAAAVADKDSSDDEDYERIESDETGDTQGRCGYLAPGEKLSCSCERNDIGDIVQMKATCTVHDFMVRRDYEYVSNSEEDEEVDVPKKIVALEAALAKASLDNGRLAKTNKLWSAVSIGSIVWIAYLLYLIRTPQACPSPSIKLPRPPCPAPEHCPPAKECPAPCHKPPGLGEEYEVSLTWPQFDIMDHFICDVSRLDRYDSNLFIGHEILNVEGVDVRGIHEDEIRKLLGTEERRVSMTLRSNKFKFHGVVMAYDKGWRRGAFINATLLLSIISIIALLGYYARSGSKQRDDADPVEPVDEETHRDEISSNDKKHLSDGEDCEKKIVELEQPSCSIAKTQNESDTAAKQPPVHEQADEVPNSEEKEARSSEDSVKDPKGEVAELMKVHENEQSSDVATTENASDSSDSPIKESNQTSFKKYLDGLEEELMIMRMANVVRLILLASHTYFTLYAGHDLLAALAFAFLLLPCSIGVVAFAGCTESLPRVAVYMVVNILDWLLFEAVPGLFYFNALGYSKCAILLVAAVVCGVLDLKREAVVRRLLAQPPVEGITYENEIFNHKKNIDTIARRLLFASFVVALVCLVSVKGLLKPSTNIYSMF